MGRGGDIIPERRSPTFSPIIGISAAAALVALGYFVGLHGIGTMFLIGGLIATFFGVWMLFGLTATSMNSQGMSFAIPKDRRMHTDLADARRTHSVGVRVIGTLFLVAIVSFAIGFGLLYLAGGL